MSVGWSVVCDCGISWSYSFAFRNSSLREMLFKRGMVVLNSRIPIIPIILYFVLNNIFIKGSLTLVMGKCLWFSVKIKVRQSSLSSP